MSRSARACSNAHNAAVARFRSGPTVDKPAAAPAKGESCSRRLHSGTGEPEMTAASAFRYGAMTSTQFRGCPGTTTGGINARNMRAAVVAMSDECATPSILHSKRRCPPENAEKVAISFGAATSNIHTTAAANSFLSPAVVAATTTRGSAAIRAVSAGMVSVRTACPTGKSCQKVAISFCQSSPIFNASSLLSPTKFLSHKFAQISIYMFYLP